MKGDEKYYKDEPRKHETNFKGPISKRSCTDIICCLIFVVFVVGLLSVSIWAYLFGDMNKLIHPTNSKGELCGVSPDVKNLTKLVFFNLFTCVKMGPALIEFGCPTKQICVSKCPTTFWSIQFNFNNRNAMVCDGDKNGDDILYKDMDIRKLLNEKICAEYVFPSIDVSGRCIPDITKVVQYFSGYSGSTENTFNESTTQILKNLKEYDKLFAVAEVASKILSDLQNSYKYIFVSFGIALVLSLLYLLLLRFFVKAMVWLTIVLFVLIFAVGASVCFFTYYINQPQNTKLKTDIAWYSLSKYENQNFWLGMGIVISIIFLLLILILIFLRDRIHIAVSILKITSKSLSYMMGLLIWPVILFIMQIGLIVCCILLAMQLSTIRTPEGVNTDIHNLTNLTGSAMKENMKKMLDKIPCTPGANTTSEKICTFVKYGSKTYVYIFMIYVFFMFFWLTNFMKALGQITIAGAFASYYFAFRKPKDVPSCPVVLSFWRAVRYHLGSLALGSLILAIVQFIKSILEYLDSKARSGQSIVAEFLIKCLRCCFWCLEQFLKFLNKNAYIMIAIYGQNFCSAARNAFNLILRNIIRVMVVDQVTNFVLFIGKLVIVGLLGSLSAVFFNGLIFKEMTPKLFYFYVPVIIIIIGTYIISSMFFQIYDMGADTIFLCFCEDLERNDGSPEKPYFMNKDLMSTLGKNNKEELEMKD